jgi:hypothetical protein
VRRADNLTTFMCRLSRNLGASTSWNPKGLSRHVMGLLYLYPNKKLHESVKAVTGDWKRLNNEEWNQGMWRSMGEKMCIRDSGGET